MKTAIFAIALMAGNAYAGPVFKPQPSTYRAPAPVQIQPRRQTTITSSPNVFGGYNYRSNNKMIGSSRPNIFGGMTYRGK